MPQWIPVPAAEGGVEPVEEDVVLFGVSLKLRGEGEDGYALMLAEVFAAQVWIEQIIAAHAPHEILAGLGIGVDLDSVAQGDDQKLRSFASHLVVHELDQTFRDSPGIFPDGVRRLAVDHVVY